ncbi:right-handed parallel beta-helix repeat-containing protein [Rubellimicrobium roseum]|uniref:right-handed parallel beta-helix repeat-containing protein n=1 Tax=Rubellimicrobium roseum TaxID=687525 RepID=UPI00159BD173|nr:right-handed parallel beta-helix repeat-containing protein [Rubellimicrobium roseum]
MIRAADPASPPRFTGGLIANVQGLVIEGILVDYTFSPEDKANDRIFRIEGSRNVAVRNSVFDGDEAQGRGPLDDGFPTAYAVSVRNSSGITIEANEIRTFYRGIVVSESEALVVRGNDIHSLRMDGMNFAQVERLLVEGNHIHDFDRSVESKDHADMIQFWTKGTEAPSRDIVIRGNLLNSGQGWFTQSIFMRNEEVDQGNAGPEMYYQDVVIEGNFILNAHLHGISVGESAGLEIANNTVVRNPNSAGTKPNPKTFIPLITVASGSTDVLVEKNVAGGITGEEGQPDWSVQDNLVVQDQSRLAPYFYGLVFVGGDPGNPASFLPKPGGPLDETGIGADMRAREF